MADSAFKQIFIGIVATAAGGLIVWWVTTIFYHPGKDVPASPVQSSPIQSSSSGVQDSAAGSSTQAVWLGFANGTGAKDREAELRGRCGEFRRVYVPPDAGPTGGNFIALCRTEGKTCERICDWEGRALPCSTVSRGPLRDATRVALCR